MRRPRPARSGLTGVDAGGSRLVLQFLTVKYNQEPAVSKFAWSALLWK